MHPYSWALHWDVLLVIAAIAAAYFWSQRRWPSDARRRAAFDLALILMLAVYVTPLHTIALHYLLSIHFLQNVVTAEWAPGLVVFAVSPALGRRIASRVHPLIALPLWLATYFVWHVPVIYDAALNRPHSLLHVEHLTYFVAGLLMWWPVLHGAYSDGVKAAYLFAAFVLSGLVYGVSYACLYTAFDRGRVTIVAPLVATESLWAVLLSMVVLRRSERIGVRLLVAAALVVGGGALISSFR